MRIVSDGISEGSSTPVLPAGKDAQQPVRQIVEIALPFAPEGIALTQHARPGAVLHALDRRVRCETALNRFAQSPLPAAIVRKHAIGFENVAMFARARQMLVRQHLVERILELHERFFEPAQLRHRIFRHQLGDDDARLVQHHVPERDPFRDRLAHEHACQRLGDVEGRAGARDGA